MFGRETMAVMALGMLTIMAEARPFEYFHGPQNWEQSGSAAYPFPTVTGSVRPSGHFTGASGYPKPTGTGFAFPTGGYGNHNSTVTGTARPSGTGASVSFTRTSNTTAPAATATATPDMIRGVNIGGWLVLEEWMTPDLFNGTDAVDEWTFDSTSGAEAKLTNHWDTYFTESDMAKIASWGLNAVRIPIGYWAYNNTGTPYISGADAYLEKAIGWARTYGIKVLVDCHGSPGSQNGEEHSGHSGNILWQSGENLNQSIAILETIAKKYGSESYADVVMSIEIVNEPTTGNPNSFETTKEFAETAYKAIKSVATNPNLSVMSHDAWMGAENWDDVADALNGANSTKSDATFSVDLHLYQNQMAYDSTLDQAQHITRACNYNQNVSAPANLAVYVGEFSAGTNICAYTNGTTVGGDTCDESGCQCTCNVDIQDWNQPLIEATTRFFEAQLDAFEQYTQGYYMWNYKGAGAWGMDQLVEYGIMGAKITDRQYPNQCNFTSS